MTRHAGGRYLRFSSSILSACVCFSVALSGCGSGADSAADAVPDPEVPELSKITFDLDRLNDDGLVGPPNGLRSLMYEFCIPSDSASARQVREIDSSVRFYSESPGRIGCGDGLTLCIGETHQPGWRAVIEQLSALDFIERIDESFAE